MRLPCEARGVEPERKSVLVILLGVACLFFVLFCLYFYPRPRERRRTSQTLVIQKDTNTKDRVAGTKGRKEDGGKINDS